MLIVDGPLVRELLTVPRCINAVRDAMVAVSDRTVSMPPRVMAPLVDKSGILALMPASATDPKVYGAKVANIHFRNPEKNLPVTHGFVVLFDHDTGRPIALIDGAEVTAIRTAAASGLATDVLARQDARSHGVFGTGPQAYSHARTIPVVRPTVERTLIAARDPLRAKAMVEALRAETGHAFDVAENFEAAARCDIVSMATSAKEPVLQGRWLRLGCHLNLVGPHRADEREADTETVRRARVYVDFMESALREAGELLIPIAEGAIGPDHLLGEIGEVILGRVEGRHSDDDITMYKSLGLAAQDLYAAWAVYRDATMSGRGVSVAL
jgi:ornithine cyclodeaminase/alanine dehydrogenase-like protein (mu-crystallin family)